MRTSTIKHNERFKMEVLALAEYRKIEVKENVIVNVSMFFDPIDEMHTTVISYH